MYRIPLLIGQGPSPNHVTGHRVFDVRTPAGSKLIEAKIDKFWINKNNNKNFNIDDTHHESVPLKLLIERSINLAGQTNEKLNSAMKFGYNHVILIGFLAKYSICRSLSIDNRDIDELEPYKKITINSENNIWNREVNLHYLPHPCNAEDYGNSAKWEISKAEDFFNSIRQLLWSPKPNIDPTPPRSQPSRRATALPSPRCASRA